MRRRARLVFPELDARAALAALRAVPCRRRPAEVRRLLRSYRGVRDVGVLDPRDPGPLLHLLAGAVGRRFARG